jgi:hypothetical protein
MYPLGAALYDCHRGVAYRYTLDEDALRSLYGRDGLPGLHTHALHLALVHVSDASLAANVRCG